MMERMCVNCKYSCADSSAAAMFCMGQKNIPRVRPFDTCDDWKPAYRTNGDAIRQMSDKELARWIINSWMFGTEWEGYTSLLDWLEQEVEDD